MTTAPDSVSVAILFLLVVISIVLVVYLGIFVYTRYKRTKDNKLHGEDFFPSWLNGERKSLIPGNVHTRAVQPLLSNGSDDEEDELPDEVDNFKETDFSRLGRIIFVMRYHKKREELMVRLVQIEGLPVSQELYSPNSAYVDVQLKYTGNTTEANEVQKPPRLDICLQQVYYFTISTKQMMSHSLEFQINTFDDQFRRFVSGIVEMNLCEELGEDILTGNEVVFVKEILEPFKFSDEQQFEEDDYMSAVSEIDGKRATNEKQLQNEDEDVVSSRESVSSNMSWEHEVSQDLLSVSMGSIYKRSSSEYDLLSVTNNTLTQTKRSHSVGYLPTYEWTVKEISLDDIQDGVADIQQVTKDYYNICDDDSTAFEERPSQLNFDKPPPESFYRIVPDTTPVYNENRKIKTDFTAAKRVAYKKHPKNKNLQRSLSITKRAAKSQKLKKLQKSGRILERSSSWPPPENTPEHQNSNEISPMHSFPMK